MLCLRRDFLPLKDKVTETAISVVGALKAKGVSTIGCAGFCWGGEMLSGLVF